jgi:hypothetical protein
VNRYFLRYFLRYFIDGSPGGRLVKVMSNIDLHKELFRYCDCVWIMNVESILAGWRHVIDRNSGASLPYSIHSYYWLSVDLL